MPTLSDEEDQDSVDWNKAQYEVMDQMYAEGQSETPSRS
jgi:hypothetical protein